MAQPATARVRSVDIPAVLVREWASEFSRARTLSTSATLGMSLDVETWQLAQRRSMSRPSSGHAHSKSSVSFQSFSEVCRGPYGICLTVWQSNSSAEFAGDRLLQDAASQLAIGRGLLLDLDKQLDAATHTVTRLEQASIGTGAIGGSSSPGGALEVARRNRSALERQAAELRRHVESHELAVQELVGLRSDIRLDSDKRWQTELRAKAGASRLLSALTPVARDTGEVCRESTSREHQLGKSASAGHLLICCQMASRIEALSETVSDRFLEVVSKPTTTSANQWPTLFVAAADSDTSSTQAEQQRVGSAQPAAPQRSIWWWTYARSGRLHFICEYSSSGVPHVVPGPPLCSTTVSSTQAAELFVIGVCHYAISKGSRSRRRGREPPDRHCWVKGGV
jgi:hypothetical protein